MRTLLDYGPTVEDDLDTLKEHVKHCFEVTATNIDDKIVDGKDNAFSCIYHTDDTCSFEWEHSHDRKNFVKMQILSQTTNFALILN